MALANWSPRSRRCNNFILEIASAPSCSSTNSWLDVPRPCQGKHSYTYLFLGFHVAVGISDFSRAFKRQRFSRVANLCRMPVFFHLSIPTTRLPVNAFETDTITRRAVCSSSLERDRTRHSFITINEDDWSRRLSCKRSDRANGFAEVTNDNLNR